MKELEEWKIAISSLNETILRLNNRDKVNQHNNELTQQNGLLTSKNKVLKFDNIRLTTRLSHIESNTKDSITEWKRLTASNSKLNFNYKILYFNK